VVFGDDAVDVRPAKKLEKIKALSAAVDPSVVKELLRTFRDIDARSLDRSMSDEHRYSMLKSIGPIELSELGAFQAHDAASYEDRLVSIFKAMIDPEPSKLKVRRKTSRILQQMKALFRQERVLAVKDEDISSHRIVLGFEIDDGLTADLALKNGAMHIVETVNAARDEDSVRRAIGDIGVSALVLERARMKFGHHQTNAKLVYEASATVENHAHAALEVAESQGAHLVNWASAEQRIGFIHSLSSLATPIETRTRLQKRATYKTTALF
jgi:hypothetical protein